MLKSMTMKQLEEWAEYSSIEPFGEERADLRAGIVASAVLNANRSKSTDKVWSAQDFLMKFGKEDEANQPYTDVEKWEKLKRSMKVYAAQRAGRK